MRRSHRVLTLLALSLSACSDSATSPARPDEVIRHVASEYATTAIATVEEVVYGLSSDNALVRFASSKPNQSMWTTEPPPSTCL